MIDPAIPSQAIRDLLASFGVLRSQPPSDWTGEVALHPSLLLFYDKVGPYGTDGPHGPDGLSIPTTGNPFELFALSRLWSQQAGYRWDGRSKERLTDWRDDWLVVADQGGDPFILDQTTGAVLHAWHGEGEWKPEVMFANVFVMAQVLGTIGTVHEEGWEELYDEDFVVRPEWRATLLARLNPILGATASDRIATRLGW